MRNAFAEEVTRLGAEDNRVVLLSGDIGNRLFDDFKVKSPGRFFNCGVAEANMMGMAAGLGLSGLRPFVYTITVQNIGAREVDDEAVTVVDDLPAALEWVAPAPAGCVIAGQQLTCDVAPASLRPARTKVTIVATAALKIGATAGVYQNRAHVTTQDDPVSAPPPSRSMRMPVGRPPG